MVIIIKINNHAQYNHTCIWSNASFCLEKLWFCFEQHMICRKRFVFFYLPQVFLVGILILKTVPPPFPMILWASRRHAEISEQNVPKTSFWWRPISTQAGCVCVSLSLLLLLLLLPSSALIINLGRRSCRFCSLEFGYY